MDKKISEFGVATTLEVSDLIPIVNSGNNKTVTAGVLSLNLPNIGNKGITKNVILSVATTAIPLLNSVYVLPVVGIPYTLANGTDGQEITLISVGANVVTVATGSVSTITMVTDSTVTLLYSTLRAKWVVKSSYGSTLA